MWWVPFLSYTLPQRLVPCRRNRPLMWENRCLSALVRVTGLVSPSFKLLFSWASVKQKSVSFLSGMWPTGKFSELKRTADSATIAVRDQFLQSLERPFLWPPENRWEPWRKRRHTVQCLVAMEVNSVQRHVSVDTNSLTTPPQWRAVDAEIKVPSGENTELKQSSFKAWSRSVYGHTCYTYCQGFLRRLFLFFRSIHLHFFQNLFRFFPVLAVANTGSCVGPQNKIGHPAGCRFLC